MISSLLFQTQIKYFFHSVVRKIKLVKTIKITQNNTYHLVSLQQLLANIKQIDTDTIIAREESQQVSSG